MHLRFISLFLTVEKPTARIIPKSYLPLRPGDHFTLTCVVSDPNAEVKWKKNGATVTLRDDIKRNDDESTFVKENVEPEDSGYYACEAVNQAGSALSSTVEIRVRDKMASTAGEVFIYLRQLSVRSRCLREPGRRHGWGSADFLHFLDFFYFRSVMLKGNIFIFKHLIVFEIRPPPPPPPP